MANSVGYCSFENFTWEDTGEESRSFRAGWRNNWHVTQCAGRDPEPLECYFGAFGLAGEFALRCKTEDGEEEDYRVLTGLIE
jgi:hypothetical protein